MKNLRILFVGIISFLVFGTSVYAEGRVYTNEDVEGLLATTLAKVNAFYGENMTYKVDSSSNITFTKITKAGDVYTTEFPYGVAVYNFVSKLDSVSTDKDRLQNFYDYMAASAMVMTAASMYDAETKAKYAGEAVSSTLDADGGLNLDDHGVIWKDTPVTATPFKIDSGYTVTVDGQLKQVSLDLNHPTFIKLASTIDDPGDNPLEQILTIEAVAGEPATPDKPVAPSDKDDNPGSTTNPGSDKPTDDTNPKDDTTNNNDGSNNDKNDQTNNPSGTPSKPVGVENPKTGVYTSIVGIIVAVLGVIGLVYLNKKNILKKIKN